MPDVRTPEFATAARAQSAAVAASEHEADDQAFVDAVAADLDEADEDQQASTAARSTPSQPAGPTQQTRPGRARARPDDRFDATDSITACLLTSSPKGRTRSSRTDEQRIQTVGG